MEAIKPWKESIDTKGKQIVGKTKVPLQKYPCSNRECNLGNFVADALVHYYIATVTGENGEPWTESAIALVPFGAIRTTLNAGRKFSITFLIILHGQQYSKNWFFLR